MEQKKIYIDVTDLLKYVSVTSISEAEFSLIMDYKGAKMIIMHQDKYGSVSIHNGDRDSRVKCDKCITSNRNIVSESVSPNFWSRDTHCKLNSNNQERNTND